MTFTPLKSEQLAGFADRLGAFAQEAGHELLLDYAGRLGDLDAAERDRLSTDLMACFAADGSNEAFALLYELNQEGILRLVYHHLRRSFFAVDAHDVMQEVFFNIYRYPAKFDSTKAAAFRNWAHSIVRNTALKYARRAQRNHVVSLTGGEDRDGSRLPSLEPEDEQGRSPLEDAQLHEENRELTSAWLLYLHFYQEAYRCLTPREKRALYLVEVDGMAYKDAAAKLDVRVENLKMRIFRARRKIFTIMKRRFGAGQDVATREIARNRNLVAASSRVPQPSREARR